MKTVEDIRKALAQKLHLEDFVVDKTGVKTIELVGESFVADEPAIFGKPSDDWHDRERRWYESQSLNVNDIPEPIPEIWRKVADPDGFINSNYGWCIYSKENGTQMTNVIQELQDNPDSRRAVMIYTRPSMWQDYNKNGRSDFMCTNAVQYMIRDGQVNAVVQMRSNDLIFGYKGDRHWQASVLSGVAKYLGLPVGKIIWNAGSAHVYERHFYLVDWWAEQGETWVAKTRYDDEMGNY